MPKVKESYRPLRTVTGIKKLLGPRWDLLTELSIDGISFKLATSKSAQEQLASPDTANTTPQQLPPAPALPPAKEESPLGPVNDADLVLSPPSGMINPVAAPREDN